MTNEYIRNCSQKRKEKRVHSKFYTFYKAPLEKAHQTGPIPRMIKFT